MWTSKDYLGFFSIIAIAVVMVLAFNLFNEWGKKTEAKESAEEKQAQIEQAAADKKEKEIQQKQLEVVSAHLKLPTENVMMRDNYDNDFGDYDEEETYRVVAKGVEYVVSFDKDITKVDKFVQMPSDNQESSSDDSTDSDSDSDSAHFPKIKTKRSNH